MSRPYTAKELNLLRAWRTAGVPHKECAMMLGRPYKSVKSFCTKHGISDPDRESPAVRKLLKLANRLGYSDRRVAAMTGIPRSTVSYVRRKLRLPSLGLHPPPPKAPLELCHHCVRRPASGKRRGLCQPCHRDPAIRSLYSAKANGAPATLPGDEMTDADLDAMIDEQMKTLPAWWAKPDAEDDPCPVPTPRPSPAATNGSRNSACKG